MAHRTFKHLPNPRLTRAFCATALRCCASRPWSLRRVRRERARVRLMNFVLRARPPRTCMSNYV